VKKDLIEGAFVLTKPWCVVVAVVVLFSAAACVPAAEHAPSRTLLDPMTDVIEYHADARSLPDDVILTRDLHTFDLPADAGEIRITEP
jgi:hypothetical protein